MADDELQIENLIQEHIGFVNALAIKYSPIPGMAQDVTQQVFLEFLKKQQQWDLVKDVKPLLAEMTRIVARRFWQKSCRQMSSEMRLLAAHVYEVSQSSDIEPILEEELVALRECLGKLPERSKVLVRARYYLDSNSIEIAQRVGMKPAAVRRALSRLREKLRHCVWIQLGREGCGNA